MGHAVETSATFSAVLAFLIGVVIVLSFLLNLIFGYILFKEKLHHIDRTRSLLLNIIACDIVQIVLAFIPEVINLHVKDTFWYNCLCHSSHFIVFTFNGITMMLLAVLSSLRYLAFKSPQFYQDYILERNSPFYALIFLCYFIGFLFPTSAFMKWSNYSLLASNNRVCVLDWEVERLQTMGYFVCVFLCLYVLTCTIVTVTLKRSSKIINRIEEEERDNNFAEDDMYQLLFYKICLTFYLCWIPYIMCGFLSFLQYTPYSIMFSLSKLFAKLSTFVVPAAELLERPYKKAVKAFCFCWSEDMSSLLKVEECHLNNTTHVVL